MNGIDKAQIIDKLKAKGATRDVIVAAKVKLGK